MVLYVLTVLGEEEVMRFLRGGYDGMAKERRGS
jgi:hypothetical protein